MSAKGQTVTRPLTLPGERKQRGMAILSGESVKESNYMVCFTMSTLDTPCKGPFMYGLYKAYTKTWFEIYRANPNDHNAFTKCYKSANIKGSLNMTFNPERIKMNQMCNSNLDLPIKFHICVPKTGTVSISEVTSVNKLKRNQTLLMTLVNGKPGGKIFFNNLEVEENPNFVDYLRSGWQFSLSCAIDFTASNGSFAG